MSARYVWTGYQPVRPNDPLRFSARWRVRGYELDSNGHVNNAVYLTYMEEARIAFLSQASEEDALGMVVARIEIDFRSPAEL